MPEVTAVPMAPEVPVTLDDGVVRLVSPDQVRPAELLGYVTRNRAFLREFEPAREDGYYTEGAQRELLEGELAAWREDRGYRLHVRLVAEGGLLIGSVALNNVVRGAFLSAHLGIRMDGARGGRGYATRATRLVVDWAFGELGLHRVEANVMPRNARSLRVLEKCGFANEGLSPRYLRINGVWEDHVHMVRLNDALE